MIAVRGWYGAALAEVTLRGSRVQGWRKLQGPSDGFVQRDRPCSDRIARRDGRGYEGDPECRKDQATARAKHAPIITSANSPP
jgi:hypothetical protein